MDQQERRGRGTAPLDPLATKGHSFYLMENRCKVWAGVKGACGSDCPGQGSLCQGFGVPPGLLELPVVRVVMGVEPSGRGRSGGGGRALDSGRCVFSPPPWHPYYWHFSVAAGFPGPAGSLPPFSRQGLGGVGGRLLSPKTRSSTVFPGRRDLLSCEVWWLCHPPPPSSLFPPLALLSTYFPGTLQEWIVLPGVTLW